MKTVEISFIESSKAVTAKVKVVGEGEVDTDGNNKAVEEAQRLFEIASAYSARKTMRKM